MIAMLLHGADNVFSGMVPVDVDVLIVDGVINEALVTLVLVPHVVVYWIVAIALVMIYGADKLSRTSKTDFRNQSSINE